MYWGFFKKLKSLREVFKKKNAILVTSDVVGPYPGLPHENSLNGMNQ